MASGFFLGGMADGMKNAEELGIKRDTLAADTGLRTRGLDIQQQSADLAEKRLGQDLSLRTRALNIQEQGQKNAESRTAISTADKAVADTMATVSETIAAGFAAGRDPAVIAKTIRPLVDSAKAVAAKAGIDPATLDVKVNTMMAQPTPAEAAVGKAKSGVAAAKAVAAETGVTEREALQGQGVLKAEPRNSSVMEGIRGKIASGEPLTGGEQKVYEDALKADPLARFLALSQGGATAPAAPKNLTSDGSTVTGVSVENAPPAAGSLPPAAVKQLKEGVVTTFANGQKWTLSGGKPARVP